MQLARLFVLLQLDAGGFRSGMMAAIQQVQQMQRSMGALTSGQALQNLGRGLTYGLTIPILAAATAIGVAGSQLTSEMARVQSVIASPGNLQSGVISQWTNEVQALGIELGRTSPEVAGGLYEIVSAFGNLSNASEFLRIAGRAAVAGQSDIATSTKNLVLATRAWGDSSTGAVQRMADLASATVRVGTLTESELGPAMAGLLPIAKLYGVRLEDSFAALASLAGVSGTASQASTQLQRAITSLVAPNTTLQKLYKANGIESGKLLIEQYGLIGAFQEIVKISEATGTPLQKMLGRIEGLKAIATLTGPQLQAFNDNLTAMGNAAGDVDRAFAGATGGIDSAAFQWAQGVQRLRAIAEDLYIAFAPAALNVADSLAPIGDGLAGIANAVGQMDTGTLTTIVTILLGLAVLGPVVSVVGGLVTTFGSLSTVLAAVNPWVWAVAAAGGALWLAWANDWGGIQGGVYALFDGIRERAENTKSAIGNLQDKWKEFQNAPTQGETGPAATLRDVVRAAGEVVVALGPPKQKLTEFQQAMIDQAPKVQSAWDIFIGGFKDNWPDFSGLWTDIVSGATVAGAGVTSAITPAITGIGPVFGTMSSTATQNMNKIPPAAKGAASGAKGAFTGVGWYSVGSGIISGIVSGITGAASSLASAAANAAKSALSAAKSALGINSPSTVFRDQVGRMIPAGMALGIYKNAYLVNQAMSALLPDGYSGGGMRLATSGVALSAGASVAFAGAGGSTITHETTYGDIIVNVVAGNEATGKEIGIGITQALQRRGLV